MASLHVHKSTCSRLQNKKLFVYWCANILFWTKTGVHAVRPSTRSVWSEEKKCLSCWKSQMAQRQFRSVVSWDILLWLDIWRQRPVTYWYFRTLCRVHFLIFCTVSELLSTELTSSSTTSLEICPCNNTSQETEGSHRLYCNPLIH